MKNDMLYQMTHEGFVFSPQFPKITLINILSVLRSHSKDDQYQEKFKDIYDQYLETNFLVNKLSEKDKQIIVDRYKKVLQELYEEEDQ